MKDTIITMFFIVLIGAIGFLIFISLYRNVSSKDYIKPYDDISKYEVYDGRNVNEYWKSTLNKNQKILYEEMKEAYLQFKTYFATKSKNITEESFHEVHKAILLDHPEIFWLNTYQLVRSPFSKKINNKKLIKLIFYYNKKEAIKLKEKIEPIINKYVENALKIERDFDRIVYIHDEIIKNTTYQDSNERKKYQNIISILINNKSVCAGYTYTFKLIMDRLNIESTSIRDVSKGNDDNHIWNAVKFDNRWYYIDLTWDDYVVDGKESVIYNNFMKNYDVFYKNHSPQKNMPVN